MSSIMAAGRLATRVTSALRSRSNQLRAAVPRTTPAHGWALARAMSGFSGGGRLAVDNPYTGEVYCEVPLADSGEASALVARAAAAGREWVASTTVEQRVEACARFMEEFERTREQTAMDITGQMGKPLAYARGEVDGMYERTRGMMKLAESALADDVLEDRGDGIVRRIVREPVGVVLVVAPWNYPLLTAANTIIPAVLAGNAVIVKHSSRTPLCADAFSRAFAAAGVPEDLVTALHCDHDVVEDVIANPEVGFVAFTGSVGGGHSIYQTVAQSRFIDTTLELGGKDPAYVASDANLDAAVSTLVDGAFFNAGQSCCGIERVYVARELYDDFVQGALELVKGYTIGDPVDMRTTLGPLAQSTAVPFLHDQVNDAVARGAKLLTGGKPTTDETGRGRFFQATLLADCDHSMNIMMEESFGPVLGVMPVDSDEEAVKLMNDSPYGLTAVVFTEDNDRAERFSRVLSTGTVFQNRCDYLDPELAWTGVRDTGKGVSLSVHGFRGVTKLKSLHFKRTKA